MKIYWTFTVEICLLKTKKYDKMHRNAQAYEHIRLLLILIWPWWTCVLKQNLSASSPDLRIMNKTDSKSSSRQRDVIRCVILHQPNLYKLSFSSVWGRVGWICAAPLSSTILHYSTWFLFILIFVQSALARCSWTWSPPWPCSAWTPQEVSAWASPSSGPSSSPPAPSSVGTDLCTKPSGGYHQKKSASQRCIGLNVCPSLACFFSPLQEWQLLQLLRLLLHFLCPSRCLRHHDYWYPWMGFQVRLINK